MHMYLAQFILCSIPGNIGGGPSVCILYDSLMRYSKLIRCAVSLLNLLQTVFTAIAVYKSMVVDFGQLNALLDDHW